MATVQAAGITTHVEIVGKGTPLVLLHGWANTWEAWLPLIPSLADHFQLIMPDLPGCGKTETPAEGWSNTEYGQWLQDLITKLEIRKPWYACGHSHGGRILLYTHAKRYPHASKLCLIDASGIPNTFSLSARWLSIGARLFRGIGSHLSPRLRLRIYAFFGADSDYAQATGFERHTLQRILREDLTPLSSRITIPTILLWGTRDQETPLWQGELLRDRITGSQLVTYDAGHFPHHEHPKEVADDLLHFLGAI